MIASRAAGRAVPRRRRDCSRTASPSAGTRSAPPWRWPTWTSSSARTSTAHVRANTDLFRSYLERLRDLPIVGDVRGDGYFFGIELVKDKATKETFDEDESERLLRGFLSQALFDAGLYCRADDRGDPVVQLAPPLICEETHFAEIEQILRTVLTEAWTRLQTGGMTRRWPRRPARRLRVGRPAAAPGGPPRGPRRPARPGRRWWAAAARTRRRGGPVPSRGGRSGCGRAARTGRRCAARRRRPAGPTTAVESA